MTLRKLLCRLGFHSWAYGAGNGPDYRRCYHCDSGGEFYAGKWHTWGEEMTDRITELKRLAGVLEALCRKGVTTIEAEYDFRNATGPDVILNLIAQLEKLEGALKEYTGVVQTDYSDNTQWGAIMDAGKPAREALADLQAWREGK